MLFADGTELLSIDESATALGCSRAQVYRLRRSGRIALIRHNNRFWLEPAEIEDYFARLSREARKVQAALAAEAKRKTALAAEAKRKAALAAEAKRKTAPAGKPRGRKPRGGRGGGAGDQERPGAPLAITAA